MNSTAENTLSQDIAQMRDCGVDWQAVSAGLKALACPIQPMEFQVVVRPDAAEEKTAGGIILTKTTVEADELAADEGTLVAVSPLAFSYGEWPEGARLPQVGDRVLFARYSGHLRRPRAGKDGQALRIMPDKAILAVIEE